MWLISFLLGHLRTARQLDRETQSKYHLVAHVQDHYRSWECSSQIEIIVSDLNDNAPVFSLPVYTVSLPEDAEIGTLVTKMHATDADIGVNRKINYTFIDSFKEHFKIIPDSGIITLAKPMDREEKEMYNLTVQAFDHGEPRLASIAYVIVNVQVIIEDKKNGFDSDSHSFEKNWLSFLMKASFGCGYLNHLISFPLNNNNNNIILIN